MEYGDYMRQIRLKMARLEKNLSQEQLANIVKVARQTISLIESGGYNPSLHLCLTICHALDKTLDELFWEDAHEVR